MILPLTPYQEASLHRLYYDDKFLVGINKLYHLAQQFPTPPLSQPSSGLVEEAGGVSTALPPSPYRHDRAKLGGTKNN